MAKRTSRAKRADSSNAALERLRVFGDPVLKQETRPVTSFDSRLQRLVDLMFDVMDREDGVGLAAPQIGMLTRVMVWRHPDHEDERYAFVNPYIVERSESSTTEIEACLSVPEQSMPVPRSDEVVVEAQSVDGEELRMRLEGLAARIVQHEIDHLDGRLIIDRTSREERARALKEMRERALAAGS